MSNLRNIGIAWMLYSHEHRGHLAPWSYSFATSPPLPARSPHLPEPFASWHDYGLYWPELLAPYTSTQIDVHHESPGRRIASFRRESTLFACPLWNPPPDETRSGMRVEYSVYAMPRYGIGGEPWRSGYPGLHHMNSIDRPERRLLFAETSPDIERTGPQGPERTADRAISVVTDAQGHAQDYRHRGLMVTAWADGHIELMRYDDLVAPYAVDWFERGPWRIPGRPDEVGGKPHMSTP